MQNRIGCFRFFEPHGPLFADGDSSVFGVRRTAGLRQETAPDVVVRKNIP